MRDVELHLLAFLQAAVAGTRDRAEYTNTSGPPNGKEAIALVSGEPFQRGTRGRMGPYTKCDLPVEAVQEAQLADSGLR
jgi:hypothetical protein